jgi:hypothetical protein
MKLAEEHKQALEVARRETDRRISRVRTFAEEAQKALGDSPVGDSQTAEAEHLAETMVRTLRRLSPAERRIMRVKAASAIAELDALVIDLTDQLARVAEKIDELKRHNLATAAYARWNNQARRD